MSDSLWLNDSGAILGDDSGTFQPYYDDHCCCEETADVKQCIYERQVAIGMTTGLIDVDGTYTLSELCTEGNKFVGYAFRDWDWCLDTDWGSGDTVYPVATTTSNYFSTTQTAWPGYVTSEAELVEEVSKFYRLISPNDALNTTGVSMTKYDGNSGSGYATVAEAVAAAKADFGTTTFEPGDAPTTSTSVFDFGTFSAGVYLNSFEITSSLNITTDYARTISLFLMSETKGDTFADHGQGVTNGSYELFLSSLKAAEASNAISEAGWDNSPNAPTDWPTADGTKGWKMDADIANKACLVIDFEFSCPPNEASV